MIFGPDVSDWQGAVDWAAVAGSGRRLGIAKATEGTSYVADTLEANRSGMAAAGLVLRGLYHFARAAAGGAGEQAHHFLAAVSTLAPGEVAVLDLEDDAIGHAETGAWALEWLEAVEAVTGRAPWLYSYAPFLAGIDTSHLTRFPLWIAGYGHNDGQVPGEDFRPPTDRWARATLWQYTSAATVPGIDGPADDNLFEGTVAELAALAGGPPPPAPQRRSGWAEIDRYLLQEGVEINVPPEEWQTTGGVHTPTSLHYAGRARDYSAGMGCDEAGVVAALLPHARAGVIVELFHAPTDTWWKNGVEIPGAAVGGHTNHAHAGIAAGATLPDRTPFPLPDLPPKEPEVAKVVLPVSIVSGESRRIPVPAIGGGFGWLRAAVTYSSRGVRVLRAVVGPNERTIKDIHAADGWSGRDYIDLVPGDEWLDIELAPAPDGTFELLIEAAD